MTRSVSKLSMVVAAFSTVVEWYDFTLYLYFATVLSRVFFGGGAGSLATTLAGFAVAYALRPLGATAFGHFGDRYGRRRMMLLSMAIMTAAMLLTALLPTPATIGPAAGWLLLLLRCVIAFSVGGEYTGVVAYLMEGAPTRRRGLITSTASAASEVGGLLAVAAAALTIGLTGPALDRWGWRIPFLLGAALAASVWLARSAMDESPEFERQRAADAVPANPLGDAIRHHRAAIGRGFAISALGSITYYIGIAYVPVFLSTTGAMGEGAALWLATLAAVAVIAVTPLTGLLSDRIGRKPVLVGLACASAALPAAAFWLMAGGAVWLAVGGALVLACLGGAMSAVGAVATAEQFPGPGRLSGLALGATTATALFGGVTPWLAQRLIGWSGSPLAPGAMIAAVAVCVLPVLLAMAETQPAASERAGLPLDAASR